MGVFCEIMSDDGSMARLPELKRIRPPHKLKICTVAGLDPLPADAGEIGGESGSGENADGLRRF